MGCLGNCIWFLCGGILSGLSWVASGVLCCITIIGIPIGMQCFKFAGLAFFPFGKEIVYGWLADREYHMAALLRNTYGGRECLPGAAALHNDSRNSIWASVL